LEQKMQAAAESLEFEQAAALRDEIYDLRQALADQQDLAPWQRARALARNR
jgi:excinuclease ABC subunit B